MNIIEFPGRKKKVIFTSSEYELFQEYQEKLRSSIAPSEALFYKEKVEELLAVGEKRNKGEQKK